VPTKGQEDFVASLILLSLVTFAAVTLFCLFIITATELVLNLVKQ
jgi:hypothetical protein